MLQTFIARVRQNCRVASGSQAGLFSLCGLLLRLRALYKWEHGLPPWREPEPQAVLDWVAQVESDWEGLEEASPRDLPLNGMTFQPFQVEEVNAGLRPWGLAYGAGFTRGLAPTFFLGDLLEVRQEAGLTILLVGDEAARDLDGTPALRQGSLIYARRQAMEFYLWDRLSDPVQLGDCRVDAALQAYGMSLSRLLADPEKHWQAFTRLTAAELEGGIRHEIGEALDSSLGETFPALLALFPQTRIELWLRGLKDALADVHDQGRLAFIIAARRLPSLALFLAFQPGIYPLLLPELPAAYLRVAEQGDWQAMDAARRAAQARLQAVASEVKAVAAVWEGSPLRLGQELESRFLAPLGL